jgi:mediator of RNA polymerase II transcription subunit 17
MALDFVSLLLSKETPRQAELSISEHVKGRVPLGALGTDQVQTPYVPALDDPDSDLVSKGWKLQGLQSSASALLGAASRLEDEMEKETIYWEQLLDISAQGWPMSKLPRERHSLGVRFAFTEAAIDFRDRGIAALRRAEDGSVLLDQGYTDSTPKAVCVRIMESDCDTVLGTSSIPTLVDPSEAVEQHILQARNTLFAEELFHELMREGRALGNRGIRIRYTTVYTTMKNKVVAIDLVPLPSSSHQGSSKYSELASAVSCSLHLLLSLAHAKILEQRSLPPPPISPRKLSRPTYQLLRPLLEYLE